MAFKKNETLGAITQAIIALRDETRMSADDMLLLFADYEVNWQTLKENKHFVEGVWSGFPWPMEMENTFWSAVRNYNPVNVVSVEEAVSEPVLEQSQTDIVTA